jgi:hypothetical protein
VVFLLILVAPTIAAAPKEISPADLSQELLPAKQAVALGIPSGDYLVEGERKVNGWILAVDRLVFKPGARLVFSTEALKSHDSLIIVARELVGLDSSSPGTITWESPDVPSVAAALAGQAASGPSGGEDRGGAEGAMGATGNTGGAGRNAPKLTILVPKIAAMGLRIDFAGQGGAKGGAGQKGGDGGNGGGGHSASQTLFGCSHGPGDGGNGGTGGIGGPGGPGGPGGSGGIVQLGSLATSLSDIASTLNVGVSGGTGGVGGDGGQGGTGGLGGPVGAAQLPYCQQDGRHNGSAGGKGIGGLSGPSGKQGLPGDYLFAPLTPENFAWLFKSPN